MQCHMVNSGKGDDDVTVTQSCITHIDRYRRGHCIHLVTYCLCVGAVRPELESDGAEHAELIGHLLHPAQPPLLLRVGEFHHQAGGGSLQGNERADWR